MTRSELRSARPILRTASARLTGRAWRALRHGAVSLGLVALVANCSGHAAAHRAPPRAPLAVLLPASEKPFWEPIAGAFERLHPGVRVDLVEGPQSTDLREDLYTASLLARDPTFDLIYMDVTWTAKFAAAGWLLPLDRWFDAPARARFLPAALAAGLYEGHLFRIPLRTDLGVLYYRSDWLAAARLDPPRTFGDLIRTARALEAPPERWGLVWQGKQYEGLVCGFLEVLAGHGGFWIDPATRAVGLDRAEAIAAARFLVDCIAREHISPPGVTTYEEEESRRLFQDGRAVFLRNWPYAWQLGQSEGSPIRGRIGVTAMVHTASGRPACTLGGWGLGVSRYSRHAPAAVEFVTFAATLEAQRLLCGRSGYPPALEAAYHDPALLSADPFLARLEALHQDAVLRPPVPRYALASDILQRHLSAALAGQVSAERAMREAARETRLMLHPASPLGRADVAP